jgi:hypothetical protein
MKVYAEPINRVDAFRPVRPAIEQKLKRSAAWCRKFSVSFHRWTNLLTEPHAQFESASPSIVRSVLQRDLLNAWIRLRGEYGGFVPYREYSPASLGQEKRDLIEYIVRQDHGDLDFIIASKGSNAARAYGTDATDNRGTRLWDYLAPEMRPLVMPLYAECASRGLPVYSSSTLEDVNGTPVIYERLLMPFHENGQVDRILASLKAISEDGKFEISNLLRDRHKLPSYNHRVVIAAELSPASAKRETLRRRWEAALSSADDVIEI